MSDTIPAPPILSSLPPRTDEDTGPPLPGDVAKAAAAIALLDASQLNEELAAALELARYKAGTAMGMAADEEAQRAPTRLERIEAQNVRILEMLKSIIDSRFDDHQAVVSLQAWKRQHEAEHALRYREAKAE